MQGHIHRHIILDSYRELRELYASLFIRFLAVSMIDVFTPIYFLTLGYSLYEVVIYWVFFLALASALCVPAREITRRIGAKHTLLLGVPFRILFFALLFLMIDNTAPIMLYAVVDGIAMALFWYPINLDFASSFHEKKGSSEVSYFYLAPGIGKVIAPAIGAGILLLAGFQTLFLVVMALVLISVIPLFMSREIGLGVKDRWESAFTTRSAGYFAASAVDGMFTMLFSFAWPVFIFMMFSDTTLLGIATTVAFLPVLLSTVITSAVSKKGFERHSLKIGAVVSAASWMAAGFISNQFDVIALSFTAGLAAIVVSIPLQRYVFTSIRRQSIEGGILVREAGIAAGKIVPLLILLLLGASQPALFIAVFAVAAVAFLLAAMIDIY